MYNYKAGGADTAAVYRILFIR